MSSILTRGTFYTFFKLGLHLRRFFRIHKFSRFFILKLLGCAGDYIRHVFGFPQFSHRRLPSIVPPFRFDHKVVWSQAEKYQVSLGELFTLQNIRVSIVIGFKKFKLEFGFKITYLRINDKRNLVPKCSGFMTNPEESSTHWSYDD